MPTRKPIEIIAMGRALGWIERKLTQEEMQCIKTMHAIHDEYQFRLKQVIEQVKTGNYEPILLTYDNPPTLIDGHMRLEACKILGIPVNAMFTKFTRYQIDQVLKLREMGLLDNGF